MANQTDLSAVIERVRRHMLLTYRTDLDDMEIAKTPGYWRDKEPKMHPGHPLHGCLGCAGPFRVTYTFFDRPRDKSGRMASTSRTWRLIYDSTVAAEAGEGNE